MENEFKIGKHAEIILEERVFKIFSFTKGRRSVPDGWLVEEDGTAVNPKFCKLINLNNEEFYSEDICGASVIVELFNKRLIMKEYPLRICLDCGNNHGAPVKSRATFYTGTCGWCNKEKRVTSPSAYGYPDLREVGDEYWQPISIWDLDALKGAVIKRKKVGSEYINQVLKRVVMITKTGHIWEYV